MTLILKEELPDKNDYHALFESTGWNKNYKASPDELESANRNSWLTVCASENNKLVGFGRVVTDVAIHAMIFDLIVLPDYQGRGIGTMILQTLVKRCQDQGLKDVQLFCAKGQRAFYEKNGFEVRPEDAPGMQLKRSLLNNKSS
jgi:ribosomal protein S18 acetylase RimI-like enzyme